MGEGSKATRPRETGASFFRKRGPARDPMPAHPGHFSILAGLGCAGVGRRGRVRSLVVGLEKAVAPLRAEDQRNELPSDGLLVVQNQGLSAAGFRDCLELVQQTIVPGRIDGVDNALGVGAPIADKLKGLLDSVILRMGR